VLVLKLLGFEKARNYAGSFGSWQRQADMPIET
jgi:3-mercaptopyruvate sulfurtransferase SseA